MSLQGRYGMSARFDLVITADQASRTAEFRLLDEHGTQLAYRETDFSTIPVGVQHGLFDLRNYLRHYVEDGKQVAAVAGIGVCIAEDVLGQEVFEPLWKPETQRTLRIQLPGAEQEENHLAAALARVPWEIARPSLDQKTLGERNLLVRIVHDMQAPASEPVQLAPDEPLRVLFVFAEARGSRPLGAREERRELLQLFEKEIYPHRRVVAHFLTHGITRERLEEQILDNGGYHVVHWSGHGHLNLLELAKSGGRKDHISGQQLLDLFARAGGFLPRLVLLSACHSGDILRVKDWSDFLAIAEGKEPGGRTGTPARLDNSINSPDGQECPSYNENTKQLDFETQPGFTGTAHALLQGGVPSVVAMRYAVGDEYAREVAVEFFRALLAHAQPKTAAAALTLARQALLDERKHDPARFAVCDHATPVLYGAEQPGLTLAGGISPAKQSHNPRLHQIAELTTSGHEHFVGRTWELAGLGAEFIGTSRGSETKPVAVITGLGGMGKTALVAEALALWESRFEWVLLYQAKPNPLGFDATLRDIHLKLMGELGRYHDHVKARPAAAIYRDPGDEFTGSERIERLTRNLIRALNDEPILLVLDNFETNLKAASTACQDPAWEACLSRLAGELVGGPSRVLITCRRPLAALADVAHHAVRLGPLPASEAALYLRAHPALSRMVFGPDADERQLAQRLLEASRFHPLLMDRLARLAVHASRRPQLLQALDTLEETKDFSQLPALFAADPGDARELDYLNDALATSLDQLIRAASPDARRLLWIVAVANDPVTLDLLRSVWGGEIEPLLRELVSVGLATEEGDTEGLCYGCHELVRERIRAWMAEQPQDRGEWTENTIRTAYAERLAAMFQALQHKDMTLALQAGSGAVVYCVQAEAWDRLGGFASQLVTGSNDPRLLDGLIPHLRTAAESAPEGNPRWSCLCYLADALARGGRPDVSLTFYEQAAALARTAAEAGGEGARQARSDLGWITGNWANALGDVGDLDAARERQLESAEALKQAGRPAADVISRELEALRIDIMQGQVAAALPEIEARLAKVSDWWQRHRAGQPVPEAPDAETLARVFIGVLDIAREADYARKDWESALGRVDIALEVQRALERPAEDIGATRFNRANVLVELPGRFGEARAELEACLELFQGKPDWSAKVLGSLADLFASQGDLSQAIIQERRALALREQLPDPADRAISHHNLALYLQRHGTPSDLAESPRHQLADLIYCLVAGLGQDLQTSLRNYAIRFRRARAAGTALVVPRVSELLADPAFHPLQRWLLQRQIDLDELQSAVDQFLDQARQAAEE